MDFLFGKEYKCSLCQELISRNSERSELFVKGETLYFHKRCNDIRIKREKKNMTKSKKIDQAAQTTNDRSTTQTTMSDRPKRKRVLVSLLRRTKWRDKPQRRTISARRSIGTNRSTGTRRSIGARRSLDGVDRSAAVDRDEQHIAKRRKMDVTSTTVQKEQKEKAKAGIPRVITTESRRPFFAGREWYECFQCHELIPRGEEQRVKLVDSGKEIRFHKECLGLRKPVDDDTNTLMANMQATPAYKFVSGFTGLLCKDEATCALCRQRILWNELEEMVEVGVGGNKSSYHKSCFQLRNEMEIRHARSLLSQRH